MRFTLIILFLIGFCFYGEAQMFGGFIKPSRKSISSLSCTGAIRFGNITPGASVGAGVTLIVPYTGGNGAAYAAQTIPSTGVTGLSLNLPAGNFKIGDSSLTFTITGSASGYGTAFFPITVGGQSCTLKTTLTPNLPIGTGTLDGRICFDIALSNDNANGCGALVTRTTSQANFTQAATHTQTYTFKPTATVSNVRFAYINTNGNVIVSLTGGNSGNNIVSGTAINATVNYSQTLNADALGLTNANSLTADIYAIYNNSSNNTGSDVMVKLTAFVNDCGCCMAKISPTQYAFFLCHNLGADITKDPNVYSLDILGSYTSWGRRGPNTTGNSVVDWQTAPNSPTVPYVANPIVNPGGSITGFVTSNTSLAMQYDWLTATGQKTALDPCPSGYRVPTKFEWVGVVVYNTKTKTTGMTNFGPNATTTTLSLPHAGVVNPDGAQAGQMIQRGTLANYFSSTIDNLSWGHPYFLYLTSSVTDATFPYSNNTSAISSVRCIQEYNATLVSLNCTPAAPVGTLIVNSAASGVTSTFSYTANANNTGIVSGSFPSTGVTGLTATITSGNVLSTAAGTIVFTITGTPSAAGTATFNFTIGGQSCSFTRTVVNASSLTAGAGSLSGKICYDVAISNDNANGCGALVSRNSQKADFTQISTYQQTYTFTTSGVTSNVRFAYVNTNGNVITAISGGNAANNIASGTVINSTVTFNTNLNTLATGLTNANSLTGDIYVIYNNNGTNTGTDVMVKLTTYVNDCGCCMAKITPTQYAFFLCHNLGADVTKDPNVYSLDIVGSYIAWGKRGPNTTGNSVVDWQTAATNLSTTYFSNPIVNSNIVAGGHLATGMNTNSTMQNNWRNADGTKTALDPCPIGYRVPSYSEWTGVLANNTVTNTTDLAKIGPNASITTLTLPRSGALMLNNSTGSTSLSGRGTEGKYFSSSLNMAWNDPEFLSLNTGGTHYMSVYTSPQTFIAASVRCIQEYNPTLVSLNCTPSSTAGTLIPNSPAGAGVTTTFSFTANANNTGTVSGSFPSTGVTGLTATITSGNVLHPYAGTIVFTITGTPSAAGTATFNFTIGGQSCSFTRIVVDPSSMPAGAGWLSGKICFDIALSNDDANGCGALVSRTSNQANFTQAATHTQTYTFRPSGTVSNVRFTYINTNGNVIVSLTGGNSGYNITSGTAINATVNYSQTLNADALGLTNANSLTADIYAIYNDGATNNGTDRMVKLTAFVNDCGCCMAKITPTTYANFLCHNLGANTSLDPHTPVVGIQGAYIQWGRRGPNTTGDSRVDWQTAPNNGPLGFAAAPTASVHNANSIASWNTTFNSTVWINANNIKTSNDPCPGGYRVPTRTEWDGVIANNTLSRTGTWTAGNTEYGSAVHYGSDATTKLLTLPATGSRLPVDGSLSERGLSAWYASSTYNTANTVRLLYFNNVSNPQTGGNPSQNYGYSVRCIKEYPATLATLSCGTAQSGTLVANVPASGIVHNIPFTGGNNIGIAAGSSTANSTGVTGLTATVREVLLGSTGTLVYDITGTPSGSGTATFNITVGGQSCTFTRTVN